MTEPYNAAAVCAKCGGSDIHAGWMPRDPYRSRYVSKNREEHIARRCRRCGYEWDEAPLSPPSPAADPEPREVRLILEVVAHSDADDTLGSLSVEIPDGKFPRSWLQAAAARALAALDAPAPRDEGAP